MQVHTGEVRGENESSASQGSREEELRAEDVVRLEGGEDGGIAGHSSSKDAWVQV